jgi:AraC-like DNA-binding protein
VLGGTTCTRERVAKAAGVPLGTVEHHLRSVNALTVRLQLRWRRSVRVVFRMCELGETEAEAAESAGWDSRTACAHAVRACTGLAPADWRRAGGFPAMLSAYCRVWESRCAGWIARTRQ